MRDVRDMLNAELAAYQIDKHGRDRYPDWESQLRKLVEEVGELNKEMNRSSKSYPRIAGECADVALALYNFCAKVGVDLDEAMREKVSGDDRDFSVKRKKRRYRTTVEWSRRYGGNPSGYSGELVRIIPESAIEPHHDKNSNWLLRVDQLPGRPEVRFNPEYLEGVTD